MSAGAAAPSPPSAATTPRKKWWLGRTVQPTTGHYRWVYLWGFPIRTMHWLAAASLVVLVLTGFYIGRPYFMTSGEASAHYLMGTVRFLHFVAAGVFVATGIVRVYWLFAGNQFERLGALFPFRPRDLGNMWRQVKFYLMIHPEKAPHYLGHNPLQQVSYTGIYLVVVLQVLTGFAMYGQANPGGFFYTMFGWVAHLLGGIQEVHFVHHVLTWVFLIFIPIHIYLAVRADNLERTGTISSIFTGGRFLESDAHFVDE